MMDPVARRSGGQWPMLPGWTVPAETTISGWRVGAPAPFYRRFRRY